MNRRRVLPPCLVLIFALALVCVAQPAADLHQTTTQIAASVMVGPSMTTLTDLTDTFGGRLTGSPAHQHAADWAAAKFRSYGIQNVREEPFTIANGWQRISARAQLLAPLQRSLHVESLGWTPSTPSGGVTGPILVVSDVSPDHIKAQAAQIKDHIILLDTAKILGEQRMKSIPTLFASYQLLKDAGALALLFPDREKDNVLNAHNETWGAKISLLPAVQIGMEDAKMVRRMLESPNSTVTLKLEVENQVSGPTQVNNVIAEIRGSQLPDEWILIGAHLDSWDFGTGAQDNGAGSVMVLEAARVLAALGHAPRRSIRFALWGGEEQALLGSYAYVQAHTAELAKCIAVLNTDNGAGHPKGWKVEGRQDLMTDLQPISQSYLKDLSGDDISMDVTYDTDHGPFMLQGVPALDLEVDMTHYMEIHHKASDTIDKVDPLNLKAGAAVVAVTAYVIAQESEPLAPHIDHAAVAEILKKANLDTFLTSVGVWTP